MTQYWVLLAVTAVLFMGDVSADQCPSTSTTNFRFSVVSRRNITGNWRVLVDTERSMAVGEQGGLAFDVEQFTSRCNDTETIQLLSSASAESPIVPPPGYELVLGRSYYKIHNEGADWEVARQTCVREGAHLLITDNSFALEVLKLFYTQYKNLIEARGYTALHVGYFDPAKDGNFISIWGKPVSKDQWETGQPEKGSYCVAAIKSGRLYARKCHNIRSFICEIKIDL
ncbi:hemolymph lipopolysaccharide-binding protein [Anabrus simplex]|uniref:hemolymph lipopolysaccharide-binding protein n=1 Tax=Anabrus simplex TaxID=316456 RepID=UPI0035A33E76